MAAKISFFFPAIVRKRGFELFDLQIYYLKTLKVQMVKQ